MPYFSTITTIWCVLVLPARAYSAAENIGFLHDEDGVHAYVPRAGDIILYDDHKLLWHVLYRVCGTEPPDHSGIVIAMPNGSFGVLEAGPDNGTHVHILDLATRLHEFRGTIWVRRVRQKLSTEGSTRLTNFAFIQDGKRYALGRFFLHATPFRARGQWRKKWLGKTELGRSAWLCSEIVIAAGTVVGLLDSDQFPANAIYPRDIIDDQIYDLSPCWHAAAVWHAEANR